MSADSIIEELRFGALTLRELADIGCVFRERGI